MDYSPTTITRQAIPLMSQQLHCESGLIDLMSGSAMPPLTAKTLGGRIAQAWQSRFASRSDFHRALQAMPGQTKLAYPTIMTWESGKKVPKPAALQAIADLTGYTLDELYRAPPSPTEEEPPSAGPLSDELVAALLDSLAVPPPVRSAVLADLAAYPPRGGVHHDDVVRIVRLLTSAPTAKPHAAAERLKELGGRPINPAEFRQKAAERAKARHATPPTKKRRKENDA